MALLFSIIYIFLLSLFQVDSTLVYRADYKPIEGGWYKIHLPANWREARLRCHLEGAVLASPLNADLLSRFQTLFKEQQRCIHTGVHATFSRGDYYSIEGVPLSELPVIIDSSSNEECLVFYEKNIVSDANCTEVLPYMCFKKKTDNLFVTGCGTTDTQYTPDTRTGHCYKFHTTRDTWSRAFMTCSAEGGHLAIVNSETEAQVLRELYAKYPDNTISGKQNKNAAHIGHHDWGEHGSWLTIHGQTLQEAGYDKWGPGQPDNVTGGQFCGGIFRNGLLDDIWCHEKFPFICEKKPTTLRIEFEGN